MSSTLIVSALFEFERFSSLLYVVDSLLFIFVFLPERVTVIKLSITQNLKLAVGTTKDKVKSSKNDSPSHSLHSALTHSEQLL